MDANFNTDYTDFLNSSNTAQFIRNVYSEEMGEDFINLYLELTIIYDFQINTHVFHKGSLKYLTDSNLNSAKSINYINEIEELKLSDNLKDFRVKMYKIMCVNMDNLTSLKKEFLEYEKFVNATKLSEKLDKELPLNETTKVINKI